ncbi:MAG: transglutaminase family protein [Methylacidiphilales bacterium]|nr:transglutaminase family protein [Candidatus Methylacidiphilales bacterium]
MPLTLIRRFRCAGLVLLTAWSGWTPGPLRAQETLPRQHLEITGSERLRITYDSSFVWPEGGGGSAVMDLPIPPNTGAQHIESFTSTLKGRVETDAGGHRILTATLHHDSGDEREVHWRVEITGIFQTRQLVDGPPSSSAKPIFAPEPGEFLGSTESINWKSDSFQDWLDSSGLRRAVNESPVAFGGRVYSYFRTHGRYTYPPVSAWNSAAVCQRLRTDCGGFSLVFTAACRANKIPARLLVGQCFKAREQSNGAVVLTDGRQAHVIAEFFDPQIGWIPEDISSTFLRTPGYSNLNFFGRDPGYFFAWHFDTDFHFDTPRKSDAHVQWIQNPNLWFSENADDANDTVSHHWDIEKLN